MTQDTGKARLPGLPQVNTGNPALDRWISAVTERLEVREGARGNPAEQVVLQRDMKALGLSGPPLHVTGSVGGTAGDILVARPDGTYARLSLDAFSDAVRRTGVYNELIRAIGDPNRFNDVPVVVRDLVQSSLADEAQKRGADIRLLESKQQTDAESLAYTVKTVTAAVEQAASGIREVDYASATANSATAGRILTLQSRINNFSPDGSPGTATLEQKFKTIADKTTGLESSYFLKVQVDSGGMRKVAGFGISATQDPNGVQDSAFIVMADKFAVVLPNDTITDPRNPPRNRIPFGVDASGVYVNGRLSADNITAGTIQAAVSLQTTGFVKAGGKTTSTTFGQEASGIFNDSRSATIGVIGVSPASAQGAGVVGYGSSSAYGVWAYSLNGVALQVTGTANFSNQAIFNNIITSSLPTYVGPPITVASTGLCTNLNADLLDGKHAIDFAEVDHVHPSSGDFAPLNHAHGQYVSSVAGNAGQGAPEGGQLIFSCAIPGFRFIVSGKFVILTTDP